MTNRIIWNKGNKKLKKNMEKQNVNAINFLNSLLT